MHACIDGWMLGLAHNSAKYNLSELLRVSADHKASLLEERLREGAALRAFEVERVDGAACCQLVLESLTGQV